VAIASAAIVTKRLFMVPSQRGIVSRGGAPSPRGHRLAA
jgi:hypothetical protein